MVIHPKAETLIPTGNLQKLLYDKDLITVLAKQLLAGQVEAHIDMVRDGVDEYKNFAEVETCIQGAKDTVEDYMADLLTDFREALYAAVREAQISVKKVTFEKDGVEDAEVEVL